MASPVKNEAPITEAETAALEALADLPLARAGSGEDAVEGNGADGRPEEVRILMMMHTTDGASHVHTGGRSCGCCQVKEARAPAHRL